MPIFVSEFQLKKKGGKLMVQKFLLLVFSRRYLTAMDATQKFIILKLKRAPCTKVLLLLKNKLHFERPFMCHYNY